MFKQMHQVDVKTGEVIDGYIAVVLPKRVNGFGRRWFAMAQDALSCLKQLKRVEDFRTLMAMLQRLDYENLIQANQAEIARELDMERAQVNRAIRRLVEAGAIIEGPRIGISRAYRLNPSFGWKGSAKNHRQALHDRMRAAGVAVVQGGKARKR